MLVAAAAQFDVPVPVKATVCGLPGALSVTLTLPEMVPVCVGMNVTLIVHFPPAGTLGPQLLLSENCSVAVMLAIAIVVLPLLPSVTFCVALDVPSSCGPNKSCVGDKKAARPSPVSGTV